MKKFLSLVAIAISIASCQETTSHVSPLKTKRVMILETNTISFVFVPTALDSIYRNEDTVWVNLETHRIDDLDSNTMMSVIKP
jgi:hypothetical protein